MSWISIQLKIKEKEISNENSTICFKDINKNKSILKYANEESKDEKQKIYVSKRFLYYKEEEKLI